jgi:hypothetical protein
MKLFYVQGEIEEEVEVCWGGGEGVAAVPLPPSLVPFLGDTHKAEETTSPAQSEALHLHVSTVPVPVAVLWIRIRKNP